MKKLILSAALVALVAAPLSAQWKTAYPDIPRVDVHIHIASYDAAPAYLQLHDNLSARYDADLAALVSVDTREGPVESPAEMLRVSENRILSAFSDFEPQKGPHHTMADFQTMKDKGFAGYKIWFGPYYRVMPEGEKGISIDADAYQPIFDAAYTTSLPILSMHINDPNGPFDARGKWMADPVMFWQGVHAAENAIARNPGVTFVVAHGFWLVCQDAQLDYLRYLLATYPNLYVDLAATFQYFYLVNPDNLRDLMIEYSDRVLFGTDGGVLAVDRLDGTADRYAKVFRILETDQVVDGGYFGNRDTQGLNLPREVLENIYYKNALKLYPGLRAAMAANGYDVE
ncbi:MAG: amidohydrolase [Alistipes sp.]|jgi:predicted TIM-barrel fold metal-dependent hydrolase|nr:amidohydrolase [Alistipes sp.]